MFFKIVGIQKEKCTECGGSVFVDPIKKENDIAGYRITCGKCGKEFSEDEWPPPEEE